MDAFTTAYIECALWSSGHSEEGGNEDTPFDQTHTIDDIDEKTLSKMIEDCQRFQEEYHNEISEDNYIGNAGCSADEMAGHHFWLSRNGHGSGFAYGDWKASVEKFLDDAAESYGFFELYLGDDGKIYNL